MRRREWLVVAWMLSAGLAGGAPGAGPGVPVVILLGPPGSGKSTQSDYITKEFGYPVVSTGALLRAEAAKGTALGKEVEAVMKAGRLVSDETVNKLLTQALAGPEYVKGVILDGYPRTRSQAESLARWLPAHGFAAPVVLLIDVNDETVMKRLLQRGRADDTRETIQARLTKYHEETRPVLDYYAGHGGHRRIEGDQPPEAVYREIRAALGGR
jgi:adenylate kinase